MKEKYLGMYKAIVIDTNDPERRGRIRVQCPAVLGDYLSAWCEPCIPYATDYAGDYYVPPVGEGIWVQFEEGDSDKPIWNGGWYKVDSSPLAQNSNPDDYRYIVFKDSVLRMGQREFIFELRNGDESYTVTISPDTWMGLNYISGYDEDKIKDLETLIVNKEWLLETRPNEENQQFDELQKVLAAIGASYNDFTQNVFPEVINDLYATIQKSYSTSHEELVSVVEQLNGLSNGLDNLQSEVNNKVEDIISTYNNNVDKSNAIVNALNSLQIDGEYVFPDSPFEELDKIGEEE